MQDSVSSPVASPETPPAASVEEAPEAPSEASSGELSEASAQAPSKAPSTARSTASSTVATVLRLLGAARVGALGLVAVRRPGVRPPLDVRQTCASMLAAVPAYGLLSYLAWDLSVSGLPEEFADGLRFLMVASVLAGVVLAALAVPVRRGGHVLWRAAQAGAVVALGVSLSALYTAARLADTPLLLAGTLAAVAAIVVNIALWSTEVRRWCGL
jgi:hypothetical protein